MPLDDPGDRPVSSVAMTDTPNHTEPIVPEWATPPGLRLRVNPPTVEAFVADEANAHRVAVAHPHMTVERAVAMQSANPMVLKVITRGEVDSEGRIELLVWRAEDRCYEPKPEVAPLEPTKQRDGDQPLPTINNEVCVQDEVMAFIERRKQVGIERYGTVLQPNNGRDTLLDLFEEIVDAAIYFGQLLLERDGSLPGGEQVLVVSDEESPSSTLWIASAFYALREAARAVLRSDPDELADSDVLAKLAEVLYGPPVDVIPDEELEG